jgi:tetratricopeptide (TPR) repeat protein
MPSIENPLSLLREDPVSPVSDLLARVRDSLDEKRFCDAIKQCRQAKVLNDDMQADICACAFVYVHEAYSYHLLEEYRKADWAIERALSHFRRAGKKHNEIVAYIMRALTAHEAGALEKAQAAYENCCQKLEKRRRDALDSADEIQANEYREILQQVKENLGQINQLIDNANYTPSFRFQPPWIPADAQYRVPMIGPIPAGQSEISTDDVEQYVTLSGNYVTINDEEYHVEPLYRYHSSVVSLNLQIYDYYLSEVIGNSMNRADIDEGDYVLLRRSITGTTEKPESRHIVAAAIQDMDNEVTLKRYIENDDKVILRPESTDSSYKPYVFEKEDEEGDARVTIVAVAVATLKPV